MNKQITLNQISDQLAQTSTKKREFLEIMERIIPWTEWVELVKPCCYKGECGNKPYDLERMLRIHMLQKMYNLADDAVMNAIIDSRAFSQFCGIDSSNKCQMVIRSGVFVVFWKGITRESSSSTKLSRSYKPAICC